MTDVEKNGPVPREPEPESPASRRRAISDAMMQALEDDMDRRPGVYWHLAAS
ncbi:MAG: hypothetical protein OXF79_08585 [Chloroflexi bacterium]|nr:hypothetical protein [Chloroflexota bacterium]